MQAVENARERERERPLKSVTAEICKEIAKALTEWWAWIEAQTPRGCGYSPINGGYTGQTVPRPLSASNSGEFKRKLRLTKVQKWRENCRNKNEKEIRNCIPRNSIKDMENLRNSWKILNTTSELANSSTEPKSSSIFNWGKDSIETIPACLLWPHKRFTARFFQLVLLIFDFGAEIRINNIIIVAHTHTRDTHMCVWTGAMAAAAAEKAQPHIRSTFCRRLPSLSHVNSFERQQRWRQKKKNYKKKR